MKKRLNVEYKNTLEFKNEIEKTQQRRRGFKVKSNTIQDITEGFELFS